MTTSTYNVQGMSCAGCANSITRRLQATPGVTTAVVDLAGGTATVTFDEALTTADSIEKVIETLGYDVVYG